MSFPIFIPTLALARNLHPAARMVVKKKSRLAHWNLWS